MKKNIYYTNNPIIRISSLIILPFILLFALYVQFHGDFGPGGGFQAGVIASVFYSVFALVFGMQKINMLINKKYLRYCNIIGLSLYLFGVIMPSVLGKYLLDYYSLVPDSLHAGQELGVFIVELGVGLNVFGAICGIFSTLMNHLIIEKIQNQEE